MSMKNSITDVLVGTVWDGSTANARYIRSQIYTMFGWTPNKSTDGQGSSKGGKSKQKVVEVEDELDSYESLVREAGY